VKHRSFRPLCCLPFISLLLQAGIFSIESEQFILSACFRMHCRCMLPHSLTCKNLEKGCLGDSLEGGEKSASLPVIKPRLAMLNVQVGTSFVQQYYSILCHNTHHLHRFYTDASSFTRAEAGPEGEDQIETVVGQKVSKGIVFPSIEHVFSSFETANDVDGMH
jgi:hypothetical protein